MISNIIDIKPNKIFVVQDRNYFEVIEKIVSKNHDIILVIDYGIYLQLQNEKYNVFFFDSYLDPSYMQELNWQMHHFLNNWFKDKDGKDRVTYKGYEIGDAFLLSILSDITYFCHFYINFQGLSFFNAKEIIVSVESDLKSIFEKTNLPFKYLVPIGLSTRVSYLFPIKKWMAEKINPQSFSMKIKNFAAKCFDHLFFMYDTIVSTKPRIFIQEYFSTYPIINKLREDDSFQIITSNYSGIKNILLERRIFYRTFRGHKKDSRLIFENIKSNENIEFRINGVDIAHFLYEIIFNTLSKELEIALSSLESIERFFIKRKPELMVPISDLWLKNRLTIIFCKKNKIPVFFIVNGLLSLSFWQEAKSSDWINSYSESMKNEFFKNDKRVVTLGDPRMDIYSDQGNKLINYTDSKILIGTSAFNLIDLNSYLAVEFDFIYKILYVLKKIQTAGRNFQIEIKIRSNGYQYLYDSFVKEYFPEMKIKFYQNESFSSVIRNADLYISFYSQTLIEAASIGIPTIYFKNDKQIILPPFDNKCELVTAINEEELFEKIISFFEKSSIFDAFLDKKTIEKYIGSLDGNNVERNVDFIYKLAKVKRVN